MADRSLPEPCWKAADQLAAALALWRRGLSVIPVPRPDNQRNGKRPEIAWRAYQTRLPTEAEIRRWFAAPSNLAVVTGAISGVVVVDADSFEALRWCTRRLSYTPWQTQTAQGFHLWHRHPCVPVRNRARIETRDGRLAIDVRGDGGYVIAPGSIHASGVDYECAGDWSEPRETLPVFRLDWLERPPRAAASRPRGPRASVDLVERARRYLSAIPKPEIGQGSDAATLYAACRLVRGFALAEADATALLWQWAGGRPGWTHEWIARKVEHAARYGTEPIGAMR